MRLGKVLIFTVGLFFCGLAMAINAFSSSSNDGMMPNLLNDLAKKIQDISQDSNCDPDDFWNKFDELRKKHMPDN
ncbi:MAG: hypothetical protein WC120_02465 [Parcubacteria group bacterium]